MRICIVVESYPDQTFIERHVEGLDPDVFALYPRPGRASAAAHRVWMSRHQGPQPGFIHRLFRKARDMLFGVPPHGWLRSDYIVWERYLNGRRPDVVLAEFAPNAIAVSESLMQRGVPLVAHFHGYDASIMLRHRRYREALPGLFERCAAIVVVSTAMARTIEALGCPVDKLRIIPCGALVRQISPVTHEDRGRCEFIAVGRMIDVKGPLFTIRAFGKCLRQARTPCRLTMIGEGPLLGKSRRLARQLGIADRIEFTGSLLHPEVQRRLSLADAFVQHSVTTRRGQVEGWGVALAEGSAAGLPCVATRSGGIVDQVVDGRTGYLVQEGDCEWMGRAMATLAEDPSLRAQMGAAAREHIMVVGDSCRQLDKLRDVLAETL